MASKGQRVFTLIIAIVFLATSIAASGAIIYSIATDDGQSSVSELPEETPAAPEQTPEQTKPKEDLLEGTKLADFKAGDKVSALKIEDIAVGTGKEAKTGDTVTAHYTGALVKDGTIFQSSHDMGEPATFSLAQVIIGWQEGVPGMKAGGKRRLIIPAEKAYGDQSPAANIPPNSDLVFDIELVSVGEPES